ncbi:MAG: glycosyltransferase family 2 protein [Proteobacteria bacterium]|nr:MAG: glycosyltransferase family 2 protein [Pseudomonadota bacterium]
MDAPSQPQSPFVDLSVVIIAFNEEEQLPRCLKSLPPGVEIIVLDSMSDDRTAEIANSFGASVYQRPFTNFAEQKNAALVYGTRKWVLAIDADEELSPRLTQALPGLLNRSDATAYRLDRRLVFMGRLMRFGKTRDRPLRLFLRGAGQYKGSIHEEYVPKEGKTVFLKGFILWHYSYKNLSDYFQRFNRYTSAIAEEHARTQKTPSFAGHILRPWIEFFTRYVLRLGFLDGYPGYTYALISSLYAYTKYAKLFELRRGGR